MNAVYILCGVVNTCNDSANTDELTCPNVAIQAGKYKLEHSAGAGSVSFAHILRV